MMRPAGAALTALCCLGWLACGDGIHVPREPEVALAISAAGAGASGSAGDTEAADGVSAEDDPEAPTTTLAAPMEAWPLSLSDDELAVIDDAVFAGDSLFVAGRREDMVVILRLRREGAGETPRVMGGAGRDRLTRRCPEADSRAKLVALERGAAALWICDGHVEGVVLDAGVDLAALEPRRLSGAEGGRLAGPLVAARGGGAVVTCALDAFGPTCFALDESLSLTGVHLIDRRLASGQPEALLPLDEGFMLVIGRCTSESCARIDLAALALDGHGAATKRRDLPVVQRDRGVHYVPDGDGVVIVASRVGAGEHTAWRVTARSTHELAGRFSRVVGGFSDGERTLMLERAHLVMRKGFPVRGFHVRPLEGELTRTRPGARARRSTVEREALPEAIADLLPTNADQRVAGNGDTLLFTTLVRGARLEATAVRLQHPSR